ncbi:Listeria/Bacterioides repeat-containing protein [Eubacterium uniforme]|uniref:Listeria/Bacterioides repeat-containing protein n=1 Tax=Eubacterium uniforme TaxID=39495 RepID=A0A1T4VIA4_9FIRM|nr:InlB B-repeat-containing protein [Eubacterium uniforme]SKA64672.1 Listeria/Bacterioides repeat-containing protein [Eubacterium uniforme]
MKEKGRIFKKKIALLTSAILAFTMSIPQGNAEASVSKGPVKEHEATVYTLDYNTITITNDKSEETWNSINDLPPMYPGDSMVVIGESIDFTQNGTIETLKGFVFENDGVTGVTSEGPIEVTNIERYGRVNDDEHTNEFITGFKIIGEDMVKIYSKGGGGYSTEEVDDSNDPQGNKRHIAYCMNYLNYYSMPRYCKVYYDAAYYDNGFVSVGEEALASAIYEKENPDIIYAEDALENITENKLAYSICRPYIEGFALSTNGTVNQYDGSPQYNLNAESGAPFMANVIENYYPKLGYSKSSGSGMLGTYDDWIKFEFRMDPARTLTLDACGGLIDGKEKIIREDANKNNIVTENYPTYMTDGTFTPTRDGYEFKGWFKDKDYTEEVTADNIVSYLGGYGNSIRLTREQRSCRMYAKWEKIGGETQIEDPSNSSGKTNDNKVKDAGSTNNTTVVKSANTLKVKAKSVTVKYKELKKKAQTITKKKAFKITDAKGKVTFKKVLGNKKISINKKTGKITLKKGLKKKTYKIKILVTAAGDDKFESASKTVTVKIKVK